LRADILAGMYHRSLAGILLVASAASASDALVIRADHAVISVASLEDAQRLQQIFAAEMQLPLVWPVAQYGTHASGAIFLGNFFLELAVLPQVDANQLLGVGLEPRDTKAALTELRARGLKVKEPTSEPGIWTNVALTDLTGEGLGVFLRKYDPKWLDSRVATAKKAFAGGGTFRIVGVEAVEVGINGPRAEAFRKLTEGSDPSGWNPPLVPVDGRFQVRPLKIKCREPEKAQSLLPKGFPVLFVR
jgi:hypothetical protein